VKREEGKYGWKAWIKKNQGRSKQRKSKKKNENCKERKTIHGENCKTTKKKKAEEYRSKKNKKKGKKSKLGKRSLRINRREWNGCWPECMDGCEIERVLLSIGGGVICLRGGEGEADAG